MKRDNYWSTKRWLCKVFNMSNDHIICYHQQRKRKYKMTWGNNFILIQINPYNFFFNKFLTRTYKYCNVLLHEYWLIMCRGSWWFDSKSDKKFNIERLFFHCEFCSKMFIVMCIIYFIARDYVLIEFFFLLLGNYMQLII